MLDTLWAHGVRHVLPIHLTTNAFGQPAVFDPVLNAMNWVDTGAFYATGEAFDAGVRFDPAHVPTEPVTTLVGVLAGVTGQRAFPPAAAISASSGLTATGERFVTELLNRGFIVDVEHMSQQGVDETLALAQAHQVPVMSSHTHFRDLSFGTAVTYSPDGGFDARPLPVAFGEDPERYGVADARKIRSDRSRTHAQLKAIGALGGMVGVQLVSGGVGISWRGRIPLDCDGSSKGFLQLLEYAQEVMPGAEGQVALASDVGGFATMPAPRFGVDACPGARGDRVRRAGGRMRAQALAQRNGVHYQTPPTSLGRFRFEQHASGDDAPYDAAEVRAWAEVAPDLALGRRVDNRLVAERWAAMSEGPNPGLVRSQAGTREFDVNLDGMAHYGMLPDLLQDSANVARASGQPHLLHPLFRSAEFYLRMWERIEAHATVKRGAAK